MSLAHLTYARSSISRQVHNKPVLPRIFLISTSLISEKYLPSTCTRNDTPAAFSPCHRNGTRVYRRYIVRSCVVLSLNVDKWSQFGMSDSGLRLTDRCIKLIRSAGESTFTFSGRINTGLKYRPIQMSFPCTVGLGYFSNGNCQSGQGCCFWFVGGWKMQKF